MIKTQETFMLISLEIKIDYFIKFSNKKKYFCDKILHFSKNMKEKF